MAICLECEKEYTPSPEGFMSAAGVHSELCPECAAAAAIVALTFAVYNLSYSFFHSGIDNAAHIDGLVTGLAPCASLRHPLTRTEGASCLRAALAYSGVSLALLL